VSASGVVAAYYDSWSRGGDADAARLRSLLSPGFNFDGPLAGPANGPDSFVAGLGRFAQAVKATRMIQLIDAGNAAAAIYDCDLPGGTLRFAEFFRIESDQIAAITLLYDAEKFLTFMSPAPAAS
jgi:hypothetical protein